MRTATAPFRILTVCTGNICRSPMAELSAGMLQGQDLVPALTRAQGGKIVEPAPAVNQLLEWERRYR